MRIVWRFRSFNIWCGLTVRRDPEKGIARKKQRQHTAGEKSRPICDASRRDKWSPGDTVARDQFYSIATQNFKWQIISAIINDRLGATKSVMLHCSTERFQTNLKGNIIITIQSILYNPYYTIHTMESILYNPYYGMAPVFWSTNHYQYTLYTSPGIHWMNKTSKKWKAKKWKIDLKQDVM